MTRLSIFPLGLSAALYRSHQTNRLQSLARYTDRAQAGRPGCRLQLLPVAAKQFSRLPGGHVAEGIEQKMNAVNTEDEGQPVDRGGPGRRLKAAREQLDLDLERVAAQLYLSVDILTALEADEYDKLPGAVFIQGYLRSYARMLNLPVEPLLERFSRTIHWRNPGFCPASPR